MSAAPYVFADEATLDAFGSFGVEPSLEITLPFVSGLENGRMAGVGAARIPGGVLLSADGDRGGVSDASMVSAVNADGGIRWVRCFAHSVDFVLVAPTSSSPTHGYIGYPTFIGNGLVSYALDSVDLLTGEIEFAGDLAGSLLSTSGTSILLGENYSSVGSPLTMLDPQTGSMTSIPYPTDQIANRDTAFFGLNANDEVVLYQLEHGWFAAATNVYREGSWLNDPYEETHGVRIGFTDNYGRTLAGFDSAGTEVWRLDEFTVRGGEQLSFRSSGTTTIAWLCPLVDSETPTACDVDARPTAIDTETGRILWQLEGVATVIDLGSRRAAIWKQGPNTSVGQWLLINVATGEVIEESLHMPDVKYFLYQGEGGPNVRWFGGVIIISYENEVEVWYPASVGLQAAEVSIP